MVLVLLFCAIIIVVVMLLIIFTLISTVKIKINNLKMENPKKINSKYEISISFNLMNKFKWISIKLNKQKIRKILTKMHLEKIDIKKLEKDVKLSDIQELLKIKPKLSMLNLQLKVGVEDVIATSFAIPIICTAISIILPYVTDRRNFKNIKYKIEPIYNQYAYHLKLDTEIEVKVINVLNSLYKIYKSRKNMYKSSKIGTYYQYKY